MSAFANDLYAEDTLSRSIFEHAGGHSNDPRVQLDETPKFDDLDEHERITYVEILRTQANREGIPCPRLRRGTDFESLKFNLEALQGAITEHHTELAKQASLQPPQPPGVAAVNALPTGIDVLGAAGFLTPPVMALDRLIYHHQQDHIEHTCP
jgi:hypothetical protein